MSGHDAARPLRVPADLEAVGFGETDELVPVVAQDASSGTVLMVAWASREALERTLETGEMHYWSRSRGELWRKGETSGHLQRVVSLHLDCDGDTVLALVHPRGPACHTGRVSCFGVAGDESLPFLPVLRRIVDSRARERPEGSYTVRLLDDPNLRTKKLGEETAELIAALARDDTGAIRDEAADLVFHLLVALRARGIDLEEVDDLLRERHG